MKPRTKYQKQVVTSNKGLRPIKGAQMQWAFRECLDHYAFQLKHGQTTCMDCGHTWTTDEDADKCVCPKCKAKLEVQRTKRQKAMSSTYFSVLTERKGLQLMRAYQMKAYYRKGQKADIYCWKGYIEKSIPGIRIVPKYNVWKLQCKLDGATVKIEVNGPRGA